MAIGSEVEEGSRLNEKMIKDISGGDTLRGRRLYEGAFEFRPQVTLWIYGNHSPAIRGTDDGIWRRVRKIPFEVRFAEGDQLEERPGEIAAENLRDLGGGAVLSLSPRGPTDAQDGGSITVTWNGASAALIASGIDPAKSILFAHSAVPAHAELAWVLECTARMGWLNRMTQFKEKAGKQRDNAGLGLYAYPVLMAADILLYKATHVPVGEDQKQHLELARDLAGAFNHRYGVEFFPLPEPQIFGAATRVMSLRDGTKKMSKSEPSEQSRINLTDDADTIAQKVRKAKTDPEPLPSEVAGLEGRPEAKNLVTIMAALEDRSANAVLAEYGGSNFGPFKTALADRLVADLSPIRDRYLGLRASGTIDAILIDGAARATAIGAPTLAAAYDALGLVQG
jgi:tryptophanyl-tRNA synthetase